MNSRNISTERNTGSLLRQVPDSATVDRYINVDSRDRDRTLYPDTNDYGVTLREPLYNVTSVELVSAEIPKSEYFLDDTNNLMELLVDPVLFATSSAAAPSSGLQVIDLTRGRVQTLRVNAATTNHHGVVQHVTLVYDATSDTISASSSLPVVFNASPTAFVTSHNCFSSDLEAITIVCYSETEASYAAGARFIISKFIPSLEVSMGTEFHFEQGTPVYEKHVIALDTRRFVVLYAAGTASTTSANATSSRVIKAVVGSSGIDSNDVDSRTSNSRAVSSAIAHTTVSITSAVASSMQLFVDGDDGVYVLYALAIRVTATYVSELGARVEVARSSVPIESLSATDNYGRVLIGFVSGERLHVAMAQVVGQDVAVFTTHVFPHLVDPTARVLWSTDSARVVKLRILGDALYVDDSLQAFGEILVNSGEQYRFIVERHALESAPVDLTSVRFYTSEAGSTLVSTTVTDAVAHIASGANSEQVVMRIPRGHVVPLFYAITTNTQRGRISVTSSVSTTLSFDVVASGAPDVGNMPFRWSSSVTSTTQRSVRFGYSEVGEDSDDDEDVVMQRDGNVYLLRRGQLWVYDARVNPSRWHFIGGGGVCSSLPGPRIGAISMATPHAWYVFGGAGYVSPVPGSSQNDAETGDRRRVSVHREAGQIVIRNVRNAPDKASIFRYAFYFNTDGTQAPAPVVLQSINDPGRTGSGFGTWSNVTDVSELFPDRESTFGMRLLANASSSSLYTPPTPTEHPGTPGPSTETNPFAADGLTLSSYTFSVLLFATLDSIDHTDTLVVPNTMSVTLEAISGGQVCTTTTCNLAVDASWHLVSLNLESTLPQIESLASISIRITAAAILMTAGVLAIRDPELFVDEVHVDTARIVPSTFITTTMYTFENGDAIVYNQAGMPSNSSSQMSVTHDSAGSVPSRTYLDDWWSLCIDASFNRLLFLIAPGPTNRAPESLVLPYIDGTTSSVRATADIVVPCWPSQQDGSTIFDGSSSIRMNGAMAIPLPNSGSSLRVLGEGGFSVMLTTQHVASYVVLYIDPLGTPTTGLTPTTTSSMSVSTLFPAYYLTPAQTPAPFSSGSSLRMQAGTNLRYVGIGLPERYVMCFFIYITNASEGSQRRILSLSSYFEIHISTSNELILMSESVSTVIATLNSDQWYHVGVLVHGESVRVTLEESVVHNTIVARPMLTQFEVGDALSIWPGSVLLNAFSVLGVLGATVDATVSAMHRQSGIPASEQFMLHAPMATGSFSLTVTTTESGSSLAGVLGTSRVTTLLSPSMVGSVLDVQLVRREGILRVIATSADGVQVQSETEASSTMQFISGDITLGAKKTLDATPYHVEGQSNQYSNALTADIDEVRVQLGDGETFFPKSLGGIPRRSMTWHRETYAAGSRIPPRAFAAGVGTTDSLWLYGGLGFAGTCADLWHITPGSGGLSAIKISGSAVGNTVVSGVPGSREHARLAVTDDFAALFLYGGSARVAAGPYSVAGTITSVRRVPSGATPSSEPELLDAPSSGYLWPVYTSQDSISLSDPSFSTGDVVWARVQTSEGGDFYVFLFPNDTDGYVRDQASDEIPALSTASLVANAYGTWDYGNGVGAPLAYGPLADIWRYDVGNAEWHQYAAPHGADPFSMLHLISTRLYLLSGTREISSIALTPDTTNAWETERSATPQDDATVFSRTVGVYDDDAQPGRSGRPGVYWATHGTPPSLSVLRHGAVFTNQILGVALEENLHHGIVIHGSCVWPSLGNGVPTLTFHGRSTFASDPIDSGTMLALPLLVRGDGHHLVHYLHQFAVLRVGISTQSLANYDPTLFAQGAGTEILEVDLTPAYTEATLNGTALTTHVLVRGITYVLRASDGVTLALVDTSSSSSTTVTIDTATLVSSESVTLRVTHSTGGSADITLHLNTFADAASALTSGANYSQNSSNQRVLQSVVVSSEETVLPGASPVAMQAATMSVGDKVFVAYQDILNSRFGTVAVLSIDQTTDIVSIYSGPTVFSNVNPTTNISLASLSSRAVVSSTGGTRGLSSYLVSTSSSLSPPLDAHDVSVTNVRITPITVSSSHTTTTALWQVTFLYNNMLRLAVQRSTSVSLTEPLQNVIGETIRFTAAANVATIGMSGPLIHAAHFPTGERAGDTICVYSDPGTHELMFQDIATANSDPLTSTHAPALATATFSLLERVGLVTADFADARVITTDVFRTEAGALTSTFIVVYTNLLRSAISCRVFTYETGVYSAQPQRDLAVGLTDVVLDSVAIIANTLTITIGTSGGTVNVVSVPLDTLDVETTKLVSIPLDNTTPPTETGTLIMSRDLSQSQLALTTDLLSFTVSLHVTGTTEAAPMTLRSLGTLGGLGVRRASLQTSITAGDYNDVQDFTAELVRALQAVEPHFDVTHNSGTSKISISNMYSPFRLLLQQDSPSGVTPSNVEASVGLAYILGFRDLLDVVAEPTAQGRYVVTSHGRIDMSGRQYIFLFVSCNGLYISSEATSRSKQNAFGRLPMAVGKGETMFFMSGAHYTMVAQTDIRVMNTVRVQLGRFAQYNLQEGRDISLYSPQGVEHSLAFKITCQLDKSGSASTSMRLTNINENLLTNSDLGMDEDPEQLVSDEYYSEESD
jgi:hypothetical protein